MEAIMMKRFLLLILLLCIGIGSICGDTEKKFKTGPGMVILGGAFTFAYVQAFVENGFGYLNMNAGPLFGQFLTKDTCIFTHLQFGFEVIFPSLNWNGQLSLGVQGRYFFSTEETINFYLGIEVSFGFNIVPDYSKMQEHLFTGPVLGFFLPFNEKTGLDISLTPLFYLPLNSQQPFAMTSFVSMSMFSVL
jgi:hypothetical protein